MKPAQTTRNKKRGHAPFSNGRPRPSPALPASVSSEPHAAVGHHVRPKSGGRTGGFDGGQGAGPALAEAAQGAVQAAEVLDPATRSVFRSDKRDQLWAKNGNSTPNTKKLKTNKKPEGWELLQPNPVSATLRRPKTPWRKLGVLEPTGFGSSHPNGEVKGNQLGQVRNRHQVMTPRDFQGGWLSQHGHVMVRVRVPPEVEADLGALFAQFTKGSPKEALY